MNPASGGAARGGITWKHIALLAALAACVAAGARYLPPGIDWRDTYRPAALALISLDSPFSVEIYYAAPWTLVPLVPFAVLPVEVGRAMLFLIGLGAFAFTAVKLGAKIPALIAFLVSPPVVHCLLNGNIDWLPLLGFVLPAPVGVVLAAIKPQIGIGYLVYALVRAWQTGRVREVFRVFWPLAALLLLSFAAYGFWPLRFRETVSLTNAYNASLWPLSLPLGLVLLVKAVRDASKEAAIAAGPFFSPVVLLHAWSGALVSLSGRTLEMLAAVLGLWIVIVIRFLQGG